MAVILGLVGIAGSIVPGIPGPPICWAGLLLAFLGRRAAPGGDEISITMLLVMLAVTIVVTILDFVVPGKLTKAVGGSRAGSVGSVIGLLAGMFLTPIGMIMGCILGAFIGELVFAGKDTFDAVKSAAGALAGTLLGTGIKLIATGWMFYIIISNII